MELALALAVMERAPVFEGRARGRWVPRAVKPPTAGSFQVVWLPGPWNKDARNETAMAAVWRR